MIKSNLMDLSPIYQLKALELTKKAAISCYPLIGKGDEKAADFAAVESMRASFNDMNFKGRIVIGEGERDEAPMLYVGEELGYGEDQIDIAVDPLEGTTLCAHAKPNSLSVIALAKKNTILAAPDVYMEKIAVGPNFPKNMVSLNYSIQQNIKNIASVKNCTLKDIVVCVLNRPRHIELIEQIRKIGASIYLIEDGDVLAAIATCDPSSKIDLYIGIGGAPEGVLAAAALSCLGGQMQGRLILCTSKEKEAANKLGIKDFNFIYSIEDMIKSDVVFCATAITDGFLLKGVKKENDRYITSHLVMQKSAATVSKIEQITYFSN